MDGESQQVIYCEDGEYRIYCNVCDNLSFERFYKNLMKSKTHINNLCKR